MRLRSNLRCIASNALVQQSPGLESVPDGKDDDIDNGEESGNDTFPDPGLKLPGMPFQDAMQIVLSESQNVDR